MDFAGLPPYAGGHSLRPAAPQDPTPAVPPVDPAASTAKTRDATSDQAGGQQTPKGDDTRRNAERPAPDDVVLTGPPPAFQASLLDLESDLRRVIAQVEAARGQKENDAAIGPPAAPEGTRETREAEAPRDLNTAETETSQAETPEVPNPDARFGAPADAPVPGEVA